MRHSAMATHVLLAAGLILSMRPGHGAIPTFGPKAPLIRVPAVTSHAISPAPTSVTAFVGRASAGRAGVPTTVKSVNEFAAAFGPVAGNGALGRAVSDYFANGGREAVILSLPALTGPADLIGAANKQAHRGIYTLDGSKFNLLCIPPYRSDGNIDAAVIADAATYCEQRRAVLIVDPPTTWTDASKAQSGVASIGTNSPNAVVYYPRIRATAADGTAVDVAPSGAAAGVIARTDLQRGVWKAPAGMEASLTGASGVQVSLSDSQVNGLNMEGIDCIRSISGAGIVLWGARTIRGAERYASEWKYLPVRRLALHVEQSIYDGVTWTANETNDAALRSKLTTAASEFLRGLWIKGAFQGQRPQDAYYAKCDAETTTQADIEAGKVNLLVGFAPLRPAEFITLRISLPARKP